MSNHPSIELPKTRIGTALDVLTVFLLFSFFGGVWYYFRLLPDEIPIHFDFKGDVNNYANKKTIFLLPLIGTVLAGFLTLLGRHPETFNYTVKITLENAERQYRNALLMMRVMRIVIVFVFMLIDWEVIQIALGQSEGLGVWFLPIFLIAVFAPIIYFAIRSKRLQ